MRQGRVLAEETTEKDRPTAIATYDAAPPRLLSTILEGLAREASGPIAIEKVCDALGDRGLAALLAFFAAINLLPLPPGTTIVLGPPIVLVAIQMLLGHRRVWLPRSVLDRSVEAEKFRDLADRALPRLRRLERLIRPRYWPFPTPAVAESVVGMLALVLGIVITLPIPLGNWLPAFAVFLVSLALSQRDGLFLLAGLVVAAASVLVITLIAGTAHAMLGMMLH